MSKLKNTEHPFFDSRTEYFREYVENKISNRQLGFMVKSKLINQVSELEKENEKLEFENKRMDEALQTFREIKKLLREHGIGTSYYTIVENLSEALSTSVPSFMIRDLEDIKIKSERILKTVSPQNEEVTE